MEDSKKRSYATSTVSPRPTAELTDEQRHDLWPQEFPKLTRAGTDPRGVLPARRHKQSLTSYIMENTDNLGEVAAHMIATMRGVTVRKGAPPSHKDSFDAAAWLADRAAGKAVDRSVHVSLSADSDTASAMPGLDTQELIRALQALSEPVSTTERVISGTATRHPPEPTPEP